VLLAREGAYLENGCLYESLLACGVFDAPLLPVFVIWL